MIILLIPKNKLNLLASIVTTNLIILNNKKLTSKQINTVKILKEVLWDFHQFLTNYS